MVKARAHVAARHSQPRWMYNRASFHTELCSSTFQRRFYASGIEFFERAECFANRLDARLVFRGEVLRYTLRVVVEIIVEIETAVSRQLIKRIDLSLARLQSSADELLRKIVEFYPTRFQACHRQIVKLGVVQFAGILAIQPMELVGIKCCGTAPDVFEIENPDDLVDVHFLPVILW